MRALLVASVLLLSPAAARAEDRRDEQGLTDSDVVVKTEGAHRLLLPRDWPVEHKDGRIAPVSIETYLSMKFEQVGQEIARLDRRLDVLDARLHAVEEAQHAHDVRLKLLETTANTQGR